MIPTVFIADDHPLIVQGMRSLLESKKYNVIGEANDGLTALNFIIKNEPTIAILDIGMDKLTGLEVAQSCKRNKLKTKIILVTLHKEATYFLRAKEYQVDGYLLKELALNEIEKCIEAVFNGATYFSEKIKDFAYHTQESNEILKKLTLAEIRVIKLIAQHKTNKQIAEHLFISHRTVERHRSNIVLKLDLEQKSGTLLIWVQKNRHLFD
tara:strand:- start:1904 stop:2533 length:630 start_codon:yes stop_codon:yes gene_type:complete